MSFLRPRMRGILAGALLVAISGGARAQTPKVYYACYVPLTGTVYRIKEATLKSACTTGQVEFSWTDGAGAVRTTDAAGGDLGGVFATPTVVRLLGRALSTTEPTSGQVLAWNGTEWTPTTPTSGGGVASHAALTGLAADDHPQYLLGNGTRSTTNGFAVTGSLSAGTIPASGAGTRLLWYPGKSAFRAGYVDGVQWDNATVGTFSSALGFNTTASGSNSTALGLGTNASGDGSTALGSSTTASGVNATALGENTVASGGSAMAMGAFTTASGAGALALGRLTSASGDQSTAMGTHASTNSQLGSWVYGDASTSNNVLATAANQFTVRAAGGFRFRSASDLSSGCDITAGNLTCTGTVTWAGSGGAGAHSALSGLTNDDHPQYLLTEGVRNSTNGLAVTGTLGTGGIPVSGGGTRLMWYTGKAALRVGLATTTEWDDVNVGRLSMGLGANVTASGDASLALGELATASGQNSIAMGFLSTASNLYATSIGYRVSATGSNSTVLGSFASANTRGSFVYGDNSSSADVTPTAVNQFTVRAAGGLRFRTAPDLSTGCDISGGNLTCTGTITGTGGAAFVLSNGVTNAADGFAVTGTHGSGSLVAAGAGSRLLWYPRKSAFRAGHVSGTQWDDANVGLYSLAMGQNTTASGDNSTALGFATTASGDYSTATGRETVAAGDYAMAMGFQTSASGSESTALGSGTIASGTNSMALGNNTKASGLNSMAIGQNSTASGGVALAFGNNVIGNGNFSIAMGSYASTNLQSGSFVFGDNSTTSNVNATLDNQFTVRAAGGFRLRTNSIQTTGCNLPAGSGTWDCTSSRLEKEAFTDLNGEDVLTKIARMSIQSWNYRTDSTKATHVGPTAQDFRAAFGLGTGDESISLVDMDGVNMLGVQALVRRTNALQAENIELRARLERLEAALKRIEKP